MSEKIYHSRIGWEIWVPVALLFASVLYPAVSEEKWSAILVIAIASLFLVVLIYKTNYTIAGDTLIIKCWFLVHEAVAISSIHRIKKTYNPISSPAASYFGRLELHYNTGERIIISPKNKTAFLEHLRSLNKKILTQEAY